jgi:hypothetical protein
MVAPLQVVARPIEAARKSRLGQTRTALVLCGLLLMVVVLSFPTVTSPVAALALAFGAACGIGGVLGMLAPGAIEGERVYRDGFRLRALLSGDLGFFGPGDITGARAERHEWGEGSSRVLLTIEARDGSTATIQGGIDMGASDMETLRREFRDTYLDEVVGPNQKLQQAMAWLKQHGVTVDDQSKTPSPGGP